MQLVGIGFDLVVPLLCGLFGGRWLDGKFGTAPWMQLVGAGLGAAAGMTLLFRRIQPRGGAGSGGSR